MVRSAWIAAPGRFADEQRERAGRQIWDRCFGVCEIVRRGCEQDAIAIGTQTRFSGTSKTMKEPGYGPIEESGSAPIRLGRRRPEAMVVLSEMSRPGAPVMKEQGHPSPWLGHQLPHACAGHSGLATGGRRDLSLAWKSRMPGCILRAVLRRCVAAIGSTMSSRRRGDRL